jgi:hypothetical protein
MTLDPELRISESESMAQWYSSTSASCRGGGGEITSVQISCIQSVPKMCTHLNANKAHRYIDSDNILQWYIRITLDDK